MPDSIYWIMYSIIRAVSEIILGGLQAVFCPVGEGVLLTMCPKGGGG